MVGMIHSPRCRRSWSIPPLSMTNRGGVTLVEGESRWTLGSSLQTTCCLGPWRGYLGPVPRLIVIGVTNCCSMRCPWMVPWLEVALERGKRHRVISKVYVRHGINEICRYQLNKSGDLRHDASEWRLVYLRWARCLVLWQATKMLKTCWMAKASVRWSMFLRLG